MEQKPRLFIYGRKEMGVLILLGILVAMFAFTLGVHLGKRVTSKTVANGPHPVPTVSSGKESLPSRTELNEQAKDNDGAADQATTEAAHDEVARTGVHLETPRQIELPSRPKSKNAGATDVSEPVAAESRPAAKPKMEAHAPEKAEQPKEEESPEEKSPEKATSEAAPSGRYTLQVGSFPTLEEAKTRIESLASSGLKSYFREAEVKGIGKRYRLFVGGYPSREAAEKAGNLYQKQHLINSFIVANTAR